MISSTFPLQGEGKVPYESDTGRVRLMHPDCHNSSVERFLIPSTPPSQLSKAHRKSSPDESLLCEKVAGSVYRLLD